MTVNVLAAAVFGAAVGASAGWFGPDGVAVGAVRAGGIGGIGFGAGCAWGGVARVASACADGAALLGPGVRCSAQAVKPAARIVNATTITAQRES